MKIFFEKMKVDGYFVKANKLVDIATPDLYGLALYVRSEKALLMFTNTVEAFSKLSPAHGDQLFCFKFKKDRIIEIDISMSILELASVLIKNEVSFSYDAI